MPKSQRVNYDFHTADNAETPHVSVFTTHEDGEQDEVLAVFYIVNGDVGAAEAAAENFISWLERKVRYA